MIVTKKPRGSFITVAIKRRLTFQSTLSRSKRVSGLHLVQSSPDIPYRYYEHLITTPLNFHHKATLGSSHGVISRRNKIQSRATITKSSLT